MTEYNPSYIKIWQTVQAIPEGKIVSYGQIADLSGLPNRARLVSKALKAAPDNQWQGRTIPWHRVLNSQGKIAFKPQSQGFIKQKEMLQQEGVVVLGAKVSLIQYQWQPDLTELLFVLTE